jgi:16S rRNA (cytosine967-C5)-methyltransferase
MEPAEGEETVTAFLRERGDFRIEPPNPGELPGFVTPSAEGWTRILPGLLESEGGLDGFFAARLVRRD